ncbi:GpE family phage tail protein [Alkalilimnicola sp. S0819]|nr:GpE family phage tail protein [Alkalilimnicola sp. S0819]MPQ16143.1 GpE family phage tail protein [Alkalilimnicola sp. S0819]
MGDIAYVFGFQPSEIWGLDFDELLFWHRQAQRINKEQSKQLG